ncbi:MAG: hypothetical protein Q8O67_03275 [Deltaproteobacteria bacterium]|nr:hypothetical protein [Deltaproteobacteria bacterium]
MSDGSVKGALRLSKGVWLFAPDDTELLWRVHLSPAPDPAGFFSKHMSVRLRVRVLDVKSAAGAKATIQPTTGVPERVVGTLHRDQSGVFVDVGACSFWLDGVGAQPEAGSVEVDVDVAGGVVCQVLTTIG